MPDAPHTSPKRQLILPPTPPDGRSPTLISYPECAQSQNWRFGLPVGPRDQIHSFFCLG